MINSLTGALLATARDVFAVTALLLSFQYFVLRKPIPHVKRMLVGVAFVVVGLAMFLIGLEWRCFRSANAWPPSCHRRSSFLGPIWHRFTAMVGIRLGLSVCRDHRFFHHPGRARPDRRRIQGQRSVPRCDPAVGASSCRGRRRRRRHLARHLSNRHRNPVGLVPRGRVFRRARADDFCTETDHSAGLRLGRRHDLDRDGAAGHGPRARSQWNDSVPNPALDGFGLIAFASLFPMIAVMGYAQLAGFWGGVRLKYLQEG